ncbi:MAG: phosphatase PAP2 family protein [Thermoleophilia bacterium]|nr:phosphatase PAP2 family protein [Thermoleophilia bacterium]
MIDGIQSPPDREDHSNGGRQGGIDFRGIIKELLVLGAAFGVYYAVRLLVRESGFEPLYNSLALLQLEDRLYLDWEFALQRAFWNNARPLIHILNFVYAWGYWLILAVSLGYLYARRRETYRCLRNAMMVSGLIGFLIFASFPVTPPRLAPVGIIDTVEMSDSVLEEVARPSSLTNEHAAMPSLHFGWVLLCGVCLSISQERRVRKALTLSLPALMGLTIIVTGNHYVIDAIVGGAVCLVALLPWIRPRHRAQPGTHELQKA